MSKDSDQESYSTTRSSPRAAATLDVEVEVAGERRRMRLVSRDVGAGGIFLRTSQPAPLWKKVKLFLSLPAGGTFEVGGEVVRCVSPEKARTSGHPAGMAVAFDEVSRSKRKELIALVLELCARRPAREDKEKVPPKPPPARKVTATRGAALEKETQEEESADQLLNEIDDLLDSVEREIEVETEEAEEEGGVEEIEDIVIEDVEVVELGTPSEDLESPEAVAKPKTKPAKPPLRKVGVDDLRVSLSAYQRTLKGDTYYDILGIELNASAADIEGAYQRLLGKLKPPGSPESLPGDLLRELSAVLGKIRKAFAILSKPDRKRAYDFLIDNKADDI